MKSQTKLAIVFSTLAGLAVVGTVVSSPGYDQADVQCMGPDGKMTPTRHYDDVRALSSDHSVMLVRKEGGTVIIPRNCIVEMKPQGSKP